MPLRLLAKSSASFVPRFPSRFAPLIISADRRRWIDLPPSGLCVTASVWLHQQRQSR